MTAIRSLLLCAALVLLASGQARAHDCPSGTFPSTLGDGCLAPVPYEDPEAFSKPMTFTMRQVSITPTATWIAAEGIITESTPPEFERFLQENVWYTENWIEFHSPGGNLYAAMELGRTIRRMGLNTTIRRTLTLDNPDYSMDILEFEDAVCASACAYAFMGGNVRRVAGDGKLGLHRFGHPELELDGARAQIAASDIAQYLQDMEVSQAVLQIASRYDFSGEMFFISQSVADQLGIDFDPSRRPANLNVEHFQGQAVANFQFTSRNNLFEGRLHCLDGVPRLVVWSRREYFPPIYYQLARQTAVFESTSLGQFAVQVDSGVLQNGNAYITFKGWDLARALEADHGLTLFMIYPDNFDQLELFDKMIWAESARMFAFRINTPNASNTMPLVLRECRR
jgi:hypothetical protein